MNISPTFCVVAATLFLAASCIGRPSDPQPAKTYVVDLNKDPSERWSEVLDAKREYLPEIQQMILNFVPGELVPMIEQIAEDIENVLPAPYAQEIIGIAKNWGANVGDVITLNILYDLTAYCTSIVAQDAKGTIWHGRNLDYSETDVLRNITVDVNFIRGNETAYSATTYAGYVGLLTGQRPNAFTITVDERDIDAGHTLAWWKNLLTAIIDRNTSFVSFMIRTTLEESATFSTAVTRLATTVIHAPVYIIVGGVEKGEGVIITRDRASALNRYYLDPLNGRWYVLETNYDHWKPAPPHDNQRRAVGEREMNKLGSAGVNATTLYQVLSTVPVLNNKTTYTTIMSAGQPDVFHANVRWPPL